MNDSDYELLETQYTPLMRKFARWPVFGMDSDDIMQELRITLLKCQRKYEVDKNLKFMTLFYGSCLNRMLDLLRNSGGGSAPSKKWPPANKIFPLCNGEHKNGECGSGWCTGYELRHAADEAEGLSDLDLVNLFGGMSDDAKWLIGLITRENITTWTQDESAAELHKKSSEVKGMFKRPWSRRRASKMMGADQVKRGLAELKLVLRGG